VLLLSTLLSPRDEDELIAHLRTLEHAEHLQTHTIPQLASSIGAGEEKPAKGLLSSLWRRKSGGAAPAGCDPDLFADEIRTYLQRASDKKREVRDTGGVGAIASAMAAPAAARESAADAAPAATAATSSWESPFEWRPTSSRAAATAGTATAAAAVAEPEPAVATAPASVAVERPEPSVAEPFESYAGESQTLPPLESFADVEPAWPELPVVPPPPAIALAPRAKLPLVVRRPREWWYEDDDTGAKVVRRLEPPTVLDGLGVPPTIAAVGYADGCRIRRVRLIAA
jgi:hypothetical protein